MSSPTKSRENKRFLGNRNKMEVHDQTKEDRSQGGCQIDEFLMSGHGVEFVPDTIEQAHSENYDNCAKCIGNSRR